MTELKLYEFQEQLYALIVNEFDKEQVPPLLRKIILDGIVNRFQTNAFIYLNQIKQLEGAGNQKNEQD